MSSSPPLLSYAHRDAQTTRFATPLLVWAFVVGVLVIVALTLDFIPPWGRGQLASLLQGPWASGGTDPWLNLVSTILPIRFLFWAMAGLLILSFAIVAIWKGSAVTTGPLWLIRIAGIGLCFAAVLGAIASFAVSMYSVTSPTSTAYRSQQLSMVQVVLHTVASLTTDAVPAVVLLLLSKRDFHTSPTRLARPAAVLMLCFGLALLAMLVYQLARWAMGTPPPWLTAPDSRTIAGLGAIERSVSNVQRVLGPFLFYGLALLAVITGWIGIAKRPAKRAMYTAMAVFWPIPTVVYVVVSAVYLYNHHSQWSSFVATVTRYVLGLLFPLVIWCSIRRDPAVETTP